MISLIIKREFIAKVRNKSFIVMTFLSPLLFVGIAVFVSYLASMKADTKQIAVHDETGLFVADFMAKNKKDSEYQYLDLSVLDVKALKDSITQERFEGVLQIPKTASIAELDKKIQFISNDSPSITFPSFIFSFNSSIMRCAEFCIDQFGLRPATFSRKFLNISFPFCV